VRPRVDAIKRLRQIQDCRCNNVRVERSPAQSGTALWQSYAAKSLSTDGNRLRVMVEQFLNFVVAE